MIIMKNISAIVSMRQMNEAFNTEEAIRNLGMLAECELKEMPDWQTVNNYLSRLDVSCLQEILAEMIFLLIRCKTFNRFVSRESIGDLLLTEQDTPILRNGTANMIL